MLLSELMERDATPESKTKGRARSRHIGLMRGSARPPLATEFLDNLTQRILTKQPHLFDTLESLVPVHRNALETGVLALAASNPSSAVLARTHPVRASPPASPAPVASSRAALARRNATHAPPGPSAR